MKDVSIEPIAGAALDAAAEDLARLRIAVFAEYPYLYEGSDAYEREYLQEFVAEPGSVLIAAREGARIVGMASASPMAGQKTGFRSPVEAAGYPASEVFYFGESVLLPEYRGRGIGHAFFDAREAAARAAGARFACFCAVVRPEDHPARPADHRPLDAFWRARGYSPMPGVTTQLRWAEHGDAAEVPHRMQFWMGGL
ncbi:MAG: GNAT family N-acetyltransferase [Citromicrobium sp.]|nr:GNAT family N-acetyltransferase [Citromicrobium sp.]